MSLLNPVPPYFLYCRKHEQGMVLVERRKMTVHRCTACVAEAREKIKLECAAFQATLGYRHFHKPEYV